MLTDLEICKRIADIEGVTLRQNSFTWSRIKHGAIECEKDEYNPLTDDALCFKLMIKHDVIPTSIITCNGKEHLINKKLILGNSVVSPNKAICLAIIEANKA